MKEGYAHLTEPDGTRICSQIDGSDTLCWLMIDSKATLPFDAWERQLTAATNYAVLIESAELKGRYEGAIGLLLNAWTQRDDLPENEFRQAVGNVLVAAGFLATSPPRS